MNEMIQSSEGSAASGETFGETVVETVVRTSLTVPAWATAEQVAEAMEILDTSLQSARWHGVHPGWGATTIYARPARSA